MKNVHIFGVVLALSFIGVLAGTHVIGAHYPVVSGKVETGGYPETFTIDGRKTFIYDRHGKVFGYARKINLDEQQAVVYDMNGTVKGYLQQDLLDSRKFKFFKVRDYLQDSRNSDIKSILIPRRD